MLINIRNTGCNNHPRLSLTPQRYSPNLWDTYRIAVFLRNRRPHPMDPPPMPINIRNTGTNNQPRLWPTPNGTPPIFGTLVDLPLPFTLSHTSYIHNIDHRTMLINIRYTGTNNQPRLWPTPNGTPPIFGTLIESPCSCGTGDTTRWLHLPCPLTLEIQE